MPIIFSFSFFSLPVLNVWFFLNGFLPPPPEETGGSLPPWDERWRGVPCKDSRFLPLISADFNSLFFVGLWCLFYGTKGLSFFSSVRYKNERLAPLAGNNLPSLTLFRGRPFCFPDSAGRRLPLKPLSPFPLTSDYSLTLVRSHRRVLSLGANGAFFFFLSL